jgi:aspartyl-tRNA(Asn)/glutamyl-tRNA(Gln) amidotransferase subunit C
MAIDRAEVERIAALARLEIPADAIERTAAQLSEVLDFVATLGRLELEGLAPTAFAPAEAPLREDRVDEARRLGTERAVAGAPDHEDGFFLVPPIVENVNP